MISMLQRRSKFAISGLKVAERLFMVAHRHVEESRASCAATPRAAAHRTCPPLRWRRGRRLEPPLTSGVRLDKAPHGQRDDESMVAADLLRAFRSHRPRRAHLRKSRLATRRSTCSTRRRTACRYRRHVPGSGAQDLARGRGLRRGARPTKTAGRRRNGHGTGSAGRHRGREFGAHGAGWARQTLGRTGHSAPANRPAPG